MKTIPLLSLLAIATLSQILGASESRSPAGERPAPFGVDSAAVGTTTGAFKGIEEGDYFHFHITDAKKNDVSYFIMKPDKSVEAVLANPASFVGKRCRVEWKTSVVDVPSAGGKISLTEILSVEWLKK